MVKAKFFGPISNNLMIVFNTGDCKLRTIFSKTPLRANVCNFRESVDSREFLNFFIFCPHNLYSTLISKITLKLVTAFYFFLNRAKFEKRQIGALSSMKLAKMKHFLRART